MCSICARVFLIEPILLYQYYIGLKLLDVGFNFWFEDNISILFKFIFFSIFFLTKIKEF